MNVENCETNKKGKIIDFDGYSSYLIQFENGEKLWIRRSDLFLQYSITE